MPGSVTRPAPELVCAISTGVNALPSWDVTPRLPRAEPAGHLCTPCTDTSVSVFGQEWQSHCSLDGSWSPGESTTLLPFFISKAVSTEVPASSSFYCWKSACHCWCSGVLRIGWNDKSPLSRAEKGKRQKEASAGECQAQWGLGKLPSLSCSLSNPWLTFPQLIPCTL